jgi:phosphoribosyl-AMP cyclohydrolase / phosphoribosyl-ATP pyrophosphohydrolase
MKSEKTLWNSLNPEGLDFEKGNGLMPAVVQDAATGRVLMLAYMSRESLQQTLHTGKAVFFSRSRAKLWTKGETSGNFLQVAAIMTDCDQDTLLLKVNPMGPACHTGQDTCFGEDNAGNVPFLQTLGRVIESRKTAPSGSSYTARLFEKGLKAIARKVGEEAIEVIQEAQQGDDARLLDESADLLFHLMVLLSARNLSLDQVQEVLAARHIPSDMKKPSKTSGQ